MMQTDKQSSRMWRRKYIYFPFCPFIVKFIFQVIIIGFKYGFELIDTATISTSVAFLCFFVNQSLIELMSSQASNALKNNDFGEIQEAIIMLNIYLFVSIALFTVVIIFQALTKDPEYKHREILTIFNFIITFTFWIPVNLAIKCQKSFKLKAS